MRLTTPPGLFCWPKLNAPDYGSTEFPVEKGQYMVNIEFDPEDTEATWAVGKEQRVGGWKAFVEYLEELDHENYVLQCNKKGKDKLARRELFKEVLDSDGNSTGKLQMVVKCKAVITKGKGKTSEQDFENRPGVFDSQKNVFPKDTIIGGGTVGRVSLEPYGYYRSNTGSALYLTLQAVQVLDLKEVDGTADSYGFGTEDGYEVAASNDMI